MGPTRASAPAQADAAARKNGSSVGRSGRPGRGAIRAAMSLSRASCSNASSTGRPSRPRGPLSAPVCTTRSRSAGSGGSTAARRPQLKTGVESVCHRYGVHIVTLPEVVGDRFCRGRYDLRTAHHQPFEACIESALRRGEETAAAAARTSTRRGNRRARRGGVYRGRGRRGAPNPADSWSRRNRHRPLATSRRSTGTTAGIQLSRMRVGHDHLRQQRGCGRSTAAPRPAGAIGPRRNAATQKRAADLRSRARTTSSHHRGAVRRRRR